MMTILLLLESTMRRHSANRACRNDEEIKRGEGGDTDDDGKDGGAFGMMSASKQVKLVRAPQSLIAGITDTAAGSRRDRASALLLGRLTPAHRVGHSPPSDRAC
jgi:hypothetical protein